MKHYYLRILFVCLCFAGSWNAIAQQPVAPAPLKTSRVAIFSPLYLDSAFTGSAYRYGKKFPKFTGPGLEFVNGAMLALDSMKVYGGNIFATIYDSKSASEPIQSLIDRHLLDSVNLIIGNVRDEDYLKLAAFSAQKSIPFVSVTYPNDGGVTGNPFLVILNSTLRAHCEAIYNLMAQKYADQNIIYIRKSGRQEDGVFSFFESFNNQAPRKLNFKFVTAETEADLSRLQGALDSTRGNVILGATLNRAFAKNIVDKAAQLAAKNRITLLGMPNWDGLTEATRKSAKDFPFYYTTSYYNNRTNGPAVMMQSVFRKKYNNDPSELAYRGYEATFVFCRLLTRYPDDLMNHLNDYAYKVFTDYTFQPVLPARDSSTVVPNYFENKRLYFLEVKNGYTTKAWDTGVSNASVR